MDKSTPVENPGQAHVPADVLALLPRADVVRALLDERHVELSNQEEAHDLGLARLTLADTDQAAARLTSAEVVDSDQFNPLYERPADPLDQVIWALRGLSAARYSGWLPTMGKNRVVSDHVGGVGEISHNAGPGPRMTSWKPMARAGGRGAGVRIGLLDGGIYDHPWFAGSISARYSDLLDDGRTPTLAEGHATFLAGLMLQRAPGVHITAHKILDQNGSCSVWDAATALVRVGRSQVDILNLSFTCYTDDGQPPLALQQAVAKVPQHVVLVAAAGNHGNPDDSAQSQPSWPAALDGVTAVGAVEQDPNGAFGYKRAGFSPRAPWVDLMAPGVDLVSTFVEYAKTGKNSVQHFDGTAHWSGTSLASAVATGVVAAGTGHGMSASESLADLVATADARAGKQPVSGHRFVLVR